MRRLVAVIATTCCLVLAGPARSPAASDPPVDLETFATDLERVRQALGIPGMAATVVENGEIVFAQGFGFADIENRVAATPSTPFGLASVTKPIAATLIMQLVEEGSIDLDRRVAEYGVDIAGDTGITVRHLLTHTSEGIPGTVHIYNGDRYGFLGGVIEGATGRTFAELLTERILVPVGMEDSALNPISSWGGASLAGWQDLARGFGWGEFDRYPDVYRRLARPYQFGDDYQSIPGMYHLYHSPAAGLVASVSDLARFDIALQRGELLGASAMSEMLSPQVPTVAGRSDWNYGLGWYVQEFEGVTLQWHTGRWPPSTSALYLRVPDEGLTFVVTANTDNLTVPFPNIGSGDLARSAPMLVFFHHFVYPRLDGAELPAVDWSGSRSQLVTALSAVDGAGARRFLERELWSHRQAFASSGQVDQAEVLRGVAIAAFPGSPFIRDGSFTSTAGKMPMISPIMSAATFARMSVAVVVWLVLVTMSLGWMALRLWKDRPVGVWLTVVWLLAAAVIGPVALVAHRRAGPCIRAAVAGMVGYALAWPIALLVILRIGGEPNPVIILGATVALPMAVGLLAIRAPLLRRGGAGGYGRAVRRGAVAEVVAWGVGFAVFFPLTFWFDTHWLSTVPPPSSPFFGAMLAMIGLVAVGALALPAAGFRRRGFAVWPEPGDGASLRLPTMRDSWWMVVGAVALLAAALAVTVAAFG